METSPPTLAKRLWHIVRVVYYMLRKNISKRKLMLDLHLFLKRSKLAGKSLGNLLAAFHHHRHPQTIPQEVQFSCSNTPSYACNHFHAAAKRMRRGHRLRDEYDSFDAAEIATAFELMNAADDSDVESSVTWSALPTPSPMLVRQLRVTDSPFPINENEVVGVGVIDKEAEKFIRKFYEQLLRQQLGSEGQITPDCYGYYGRKWR